ncbi:MAG: glycoside hydrolase family 32 protein [Gemmatimonadaceae bacterium]
MPNVVTGDLGVVGSLVAIARCRHRPWHALMTRAVRVAGLLAVVTACGGEQRHDKGASAVVRAYDEPHRPQLHFSPASGWMNDPNGLVYHAGVYHLFYQYYPDSTVWGPMHWGHAVSRDMVHWTPQPIALRPDSLGYIFSGSAVFDSTNTSRLGAPNRPPLVAMFTYHNPTGEKAGSSNFQSQAIAWSTDEGNSWSKYTANPVIPNPGSTRDFRDPKVTWDADRSRWVVVLAAGDHAEFWASPNLTTWTKLSEFGKGLGSHDGVWECPDFFPMVVDGTTERRWVLLQSVGQGHPNGGTGTQYFIGDFDGTRFTVDPQFARAVQHGNAQWVDFGRDDYAGVTWSNAPDGRRLFLGWMSNWQYATRVPTTSWRSAMTVPRELTLVKAASGYRLRMTPIAEFNRLRRQTRPLTHNQSTAYSTSRNRRALRRCCWS